MQTTCRNCLDKKHRNNFNKQPFNQAKIKYRQLKNQTRGGMDLEKRKNSQMKHYRSLNNQAKGSKRDDNKQRQSIYK